MSLETILIELKQKKRALEAAITALESLQKDKRRSGTRTLKRAKSDVRATTGKRRISEIQTQVAVGLEGGRVIPFPGARRSRKSRPHSEEVKA